MGIPEAVLTDPAAQRVVETLVERGVLVRVWDEGRQMRVYQLADANDGPGKDASER